ncbi:MAG: peptide MFS transporter [Acidobacteria bacterium]|nr:peptide MFS transporter [Acidobacteriota bacterium]
MSYPASTVISPEDDYNNEKFNYSKADKEGIGGHPRGLTPLFFTEMWERFSYYGMRAILVLYMVSPIEKGGLGFSVEKATFIFGLYTAAVYFTALPGGLIADRLIGARNAVLIGGITIALGHYAMVLPSISFFYLGMGLITLGTGLLKPNISAMVGSLYGENDPRRDGGFSLFYMGINLGAMAAPIVCGYLAQGQSFQQKLLSLGLNPANSWHWGFGAAGVGMTLGLIQYLAQQKRLAHVGLKPTKNITSVSTNNEKLTLDEWKRLAAISVLFVFNTIFFAAFEQSGSSLTLFADQLTRAEVFGWQFPSSWFQSINSIFIMILAPLFSLLWLRLDKRAPSSPAKFAFGLFFLSIGFFLLVPAAYLTSTGRVNPIWLVLLYFFHTVGELCLSPVGLSTVTRIAPIRLVGLMMGCWFLATSVGNFFSGWIASFFVASSPMILVKMFGSLALGALVASIILTLLKPSICKLMQSTSNVK